MSAETMAWLSDSVRVGFSGQRGDAWWARMAGKTTADGSPNHFDGPVPVDVALDLLKRVDPIGVPVQFTMPEVITLDGVTPGELRTDDTRQVIVDRATGEVFAVFSDGYIIHDYTEWLLRNVENILDDDLGIGSVGLLEKGAVAWLSVEVPEAMTVAGVTYRPNLLAMTSHNGKRATGYARVVTNVVCDNTMAIAASEKGQKIKYKHTKYSTAKITDAREALSIVHTMADDFAREVEELTSTTVTDAEWQKFLDLYVPIEDSMTARSKTMAENKLGELNRLYKFDARVGDHKGTAWGVMQAVNTYDQHYAIARGLGDGNQAQARYDRSLMAATDGSLTKQAATVRELIGAVKG
jgi:phage/plasmid-like protein (TIGR03299 family)